LLLPERVDPKAPHTWVVVVVLAILAMVPLYAAATGQAYYLTLVSRMMIYAIAATSLNLLVGYTGLVSLGQALFLGVGAYCVGIPMLKGVDNGWLQLLMVVVASGVVGAVTGIVVLRTRGMAFIMITLAFAQMFYYLGVSLKEYGGDDGMSLPGRSVLAPLDLESDRQLYYLIFAILLASLYLSWRLVHSRFGYVLRGIHSNERRMRALGFATTRYKLAIYTVAGIVTGIAGFLMANLTNYVSPSISAWTVSGELVVMVILGGLGTVFGGTLGALALLLIEDILSGITEHWMAILGLFIVAIVLVAKNGIYGSLRQWSVSRERRRERARVGGPVAAGAPSAATTVATGRSPAEPRR
jgi:branched-chain amino acid transport system permease protein